MPCTNGDSACTDIDNSIWKSTKCECSTGYSEDLTDGSTCVQGMTYYITKKNEI